MHRSILACAVLLASLHLSAGDAAAQASRTEGFLLGARLNWTAITPDEEDTESAVGIGAILGYGFSPAIAIYLNVDGAVLDVDGEEMTAGFGDLGLRYTFGTNAAAVRPFLNAALTGASLRFDIGDGREVELRGGGATVGGGVNYFLSRRVALEGALQLTFGRYNEARVERVTVPLDDLEFDFRATRVQLGVNFRP
jgi:hypothetical protein